MCENGTGTFLGTLGASAHYRCVNCGWQWRGDSLPEEPDFDLNESAVCVRCGVELGHVPGLDSEICGSCEHEDDENCA